MHFYAKDTELQASICNEQYKIYYHSQLIPWRPFVHAPPHGRACACILMLEIVEILIQLQCTRICLQDGSVVNKESNTFVN